MDDIDLAQEKHLNSNSHRFLDPSEYKHCRIPTWLTPDKAKDIYSELKDFLKSELRNAKNANPVSSKIYLGKIQEYRMSVSKHEDNGGDLDSQDMNLKLIIMYKIQDLLYLKYGIEEEQLKMVLEDSER